MRQTQVLLLTFVVLLADQTLKIWVKTNMILNTEFKVLGDWFRIHFSENKGMAFGWELGGDWGKLALTMFRIVAVIFIYYMIHGLIKKKAHWGFIMAMSLIFAGAIGNIIDSVFYGVVFDSSYRQVAEFLPEAGGYGTWFHGKVVDMLYFPLWSGYVADWVPLIGGRINTFFAPIFNIADSAISVGVFIILLFNKTFLKEEEEYEAAKKLAEEKAAE